MKSPTSGLQREANAWIKHAPCSSPDIPVDLFFPERGATRQVRAAKKICSGCDYKQQCLALGLEIDAPGIWGGTSEMDRRRMRTIANRNNERHL